MAKEFKRACVTGGAGFIGSHLVEALLDKQVEVTVLDNLSTGKRENVASPARLVVGDILDTELATDALSGSDVVFHLAARVAIRSSFEFAVDDTRINVTGTASVLRAAKNAGVRKVICASSMAVYADQPLRKPVPEEFATAPISPYGISKLAAERLTHLMCAEANIESVVLRLFNTYGPRQVFSPYVGVVTIFINNLLSGTNPRIFGDGEQCRDFVHAKDVARGFVQAMEAQLTGETINIGSGQPRTVNELLSSVQRATGSTLSGRHLEALPGELCYSVADISKARRLLGYQPTEHFDSALASVVEEIQKGVAA